MLFIVECTKTRLSSCQILSSNLIIERMIFLPYWKYGRKKQSYYISKQSRKSVFCFQPMYFLAVAPFLKSKGKDTFAHDRGNVIQDGLHKTESILRRDVFKPMLQTTSYGMYNFLFSDCLQW